MKINKVSRNFSTASQITVDDIPAIKAAGIASIICSRPNGESEEQVVFEEIAAAAKAEGIKAVHIPLVRDQEPTSQVQEYAKALAELPHPVLGYCRTGFRSTTLWSLANLGNLTRSEIVDATKNAGYDMFSYLYYGNKPTV